MRYADTLLSEGERVIIRRRQHWLALLIDGRTGVVLILVGLVLLGVYAWGPFQSEPARSLVGWVTLATLVIGFVLFALQYWRWWAQDYMITNRRILKVEGVFNKLASDSSLEKINDAVLDQNIFGRIFNYGDLDILTAAEGSAIDKYRMLNRALEFKREMLNQKHALETGYAYQQPPSPPLRTAPAADRPSREPAEAQPAYQPAGPQAARSPSYESVMAPRSADAAGDAADIRGGGAASY